MQLIRVIRTKNCPENMENVSFHATCLFMYSLRSPGNLWFSDVFRGYRNRPVTCNELSKNLRKAYIGLTT